MSRQPTFPLPLSPEDVCRHALAAYYRAVGEGTAPRGYPDPAAWSDPEMFVATLCEYFELRLRFEAAQAGHAVESDPVLYVHWSNLLPAAQRHVRDVDPGLWAEACIEHPELLADLPGLAGGGRSPPDMGHGCPALTAVGPAPAPSEAADTAPENRSFLGLPGKELPVRDPLNIIEPRAGRGEV
jgi:hypothetical protein